MKEEVDIDYKDMKIEIDELVQNVKEERYFELYDVDILGPKYRLDEKVENLKLDVRNEV